MKKSDILILFNARIWKRISHQSRKEQFAELQGQKFQDVPQQLSRNYSKSLSRVRSKSNIHTLAHTVLIPPLRSTPTNTTRISAPPCSTQPHASTPKGRPATRPSKVSTCEPPTSPTCQMYPLLHPDQHRTADGKEKAWGAYPLHEGINSQGNQSQKQSRHQLAPSPQQQRILPPSLRLTVQKIR